MICNNVHAVGVLFSFILDRIIIPRGVGYCFIMWLRQFPWPQVNNGAIRPRILYVRMIIISIHIIINLNPNQR